MPTHSTRFLRVVAYLSASGLVLSSAGFGCVYAYRVGIQTGPEIAALSVLMALALEGIKPIAVSGVYVSLKSFEFLRASLLAILALVAIAYSLTSELSLMATSRGDLVASRENAAVGAQDVRATRQRLTQELASLGILEPSTALRAKLADKRLKKSEQVSLKTNLAKAERRETIERQLAGLQTMGTPPPVKSADPGSTALATYLGLLKITLPVDVVSQWLNLVPVLALEVGSSLAFLLISSQLTIHVPAMALEAPQLTVQRDFKTSGTNDSKETSVSDLREPTPKDAHKETHEKILKTIKENGGSLSYSERGLAKLIGSNRSTTKRALSALVSSGLVSVDAISKAGTHVKLSNLS